MSHSPCHPNLQNIPFQVTFIVQDTYSVPQLRILLYQPLQYLHATVCSAIINEYELTVAVSLFKDAPATLLYVRFHIVYRNDN